MPVHDWTRVDAGIFHSFHLSRVVEISKGLNGGGLPEAFYALVEQHSERTIPDVLSLHASPATLERLCESVEAAALVRRRSVAIRHVSGHRLVALLEIVSPANKYRQRSVDDFTNKAVDALNAGIHLVVVDLFPPGSYDPQGMHGAIRRRLAEPDESDNTSAAEPLTVASYVAGSPLDIYLEQLRVGAVLPEMPLFLNRERYVSLPLEATYQAAYQGMPSFWRGVLEGTQALPAGN